MNERHDWQTGKITPLFHLPIFSGPLDEERMMLFLDEPDDCESKRAFLNQCALSQGDLDRWNTLCDVIDAGKELSIHIPDPSVRSRILDVAYASVQGNEPRRSSSPYLGLPGWKWAWAALFLAFLWSGYQEMSPSTVSPSSLTTANDTLDYELLTLEEQVNQLQTELSQELVSGVEGSA